LTRRLMSTLAPIVGSDKIRATVNVEYETGSSEESQEKYDPAVTATLSMQHSEESAGGSTSVGGVPGTSSNVPGIKNPAAAAVKDGGQSSKTDNNTYAVNKTVRHVIEPAGSIRRITAAVVLDDAVERKQVSGKWVELHHKRQPDELKYISELAQAAIGFNSARGDVMSVQNLTFDHPTEADAQPVTFVEKAKKGLDDYSSIVRYGVLLTLFLLVYLLVLRPLQARALAAPKSLLAQHQVAGGTEAALAAPPEFAATLAQRSLMLKKQLSEFVQAEPESSSTAVNSWLREEAR